MLYIFSKYFYADLFFKGVVIVFLRHSALSSLFWTVVLDQAGFILQTRMSASGGFAEAKAKIL